MADPEVVVDTQTPQEDTEMENVPDITADETTADETTVAGEGGDHEDAGLEDIEPTITERTGFIEYARRDFVQPMNTS